MAERPDNPYIPNTAEDQAIMRARLDLDDIERRFDELPAEHRQPDIDVPPPLAEADLVRLMEMRAVENADGNRPSFLGAGAYRRWVPTVTGHLLSRSEFVTSYTPY